MRILITGYKGFIGKNLYNYLGFGGYDVQGYELGDKLPRLDTFTHIIHLGAISSTTETDVNKVMIQNIQSSYDLIDAAAEANIHFMYASSASVYGSTYRFAESDPLDPKSLYAWSKYCVERYAQAKFSTNPIQGFRFFNVYGSHEEHKGSQQSVFHTFKQQAKETGIVKQFSNSDSVYRDFIFVNDVCQILEDFLFIEQSGIWNVGTGRITSFADIAAYVANKYNAIVVDTPIPHTVKNQYQYYTKSNNVKLLSTIGSYTFKHWKEWVDDQI